MTFDWTRGLNTDAIVQGSNTWSATPSGLTFASQTIVTGGLKTSALVTGGAARTYIVTNRVTTSDGETLEESGKLQVRQSG